MTLLALGIALRLALPTLIQRSIAYGSRHYLGLPVHVEEVHLSLLNGNIIFQNLNVASHPDNIRPRDAAWRLPSIDPALALLHFEQITMRWSWRKLLRKKIQITELSVKTPTIHILREADGDIDPLRHAQPLALPSNEEDANAANGTVNPWTIEIQHFRVHTPTLDLLDATNRASLLEFSLESFELNSISIRGGNLQLGAAAIHGPVLRVWPEYVWTDSSSSKAAPLAKDTSATSASTSPVNTTSYRLEKIAVEHAKFTWVTKEDPLDVMLTFNASEITAEENKRFPLDLTLQIDSGKIALTGTAGILPPFFQGKLTWSDLSFPPLLLAVQPDLAPWLQSANSKGDLNIVITTDGKNKTPGLSASGRITVNSLAAANPGTQEISLGWNRLDMVIQEVFIPFAEEGNPPRATKLNFDRITLDAPQIYYTHPSPSLKAFTSTPPSSQKKATSPALFDLRVGVLELTDGEMTIADTTVASSSHLRNLQLKMRETRFPATTFEALTLQALLPSAAKLLLEGNLAADQTGNFVMALEGLDLPPWNPYAKQAGVSLDAGQATLRTKLGIHNTAFQADNEIILTQFDVSLRDPDSFTKQFGVPLDLALALLRDSAGNIKLTLPIRLDERGMTTSTGAIIGSALRAALIGAISSPLKLLNAGFAIPLGQKKTSKNSTAAEESPLTLTSIKSIAGSADPLPEDNEKIRSLAKLLANRPTIGLELRGRTGEEDRPLLGAQLLRERVQAGLRFPEVADSGFLARRRIHHYLTKLNKGESAVLENEDRELYERYVAAVEIPESRWMALANQRAEKIKSLLLAQKVDAKNITLGRPELSGGAGVIISFQQSPKENLEKPTLKKGKKVSQP